VLSQGKLPITEYYGLVNKNLTLQINKTIMTYGRNKPLTAEMNEKHKNTALRVFITGLNGHISDVKFSINPPDLPSTRLTEQKQQFEGPIRKQFYIITNYESNLFGYQNSNKNPQER